MKTSAGKTYLCFYLLFTVLLSGRQAFAVHLDVEVWGQGNALFTGYCRTPGAVGCDLDGLAEVLHLPAGTLPIEAVTGKLIFPADFQDLPGGDFKTKNPGFQSIQNALLPNELLSYRALGALKYWDPLLSSWGKPPEGIQIRLFGGLEASADIINDLSQCTGQLICFSDGVFGSDGSTIFSANGISGNPELVVDITGSNGVLHTHLSFFLENQKGQIGGPAGAFLIEMQLISNARFFPSAPFFILFNAGLREDEFAAALLALTGGITAPDPDPPQPFIPASIPGDVDFDGDVDRLDVALILLAAQNNEPMRSSNAMLDVDRDGVINRADAFLAKQLCTLRLCNIPVLAPATVLNVAAVYDEKNSILDLNDVQVSNLHYRAQLQLKDNNLFELNSLQLDKSRYAIPARYDIEAAILEIPSVYIHEKNYKATLRNIGDSKFRLEYFEEINTIFK